MPTAPTDGVQVIGRTSRELALAGRRQRQLGGHLPGKSVRKGENDLRPARCVMLGATIDDDDDGFDASFASSTAAPTDSSVVAADTADVPTEHAPPLLPGPADNDDFFDGMFDGLIAPPSLHPRRPPALVSPSI